jgi:glycosyltransferase involved in cell wall biosynthesis
MHVLLLNQFFHPDVSAVAQLATDLAEDLVTAGFRVTALAARGSYLGGARLPEREEYSGVRIIRVQSTSFGKSSIAARIADYGSFLISAFGRLAIAEKPDVILAMSTPPFVSAAGAAIRSLRGTRFVYWAQDLYPELAVEFGLLRRGSPVTRMLEWASARIVLRADAVITLGEAMAARLVGKGARPERVHIVPNWADPDAIRPIPHEANPFRAAHGLDGKRVVLYSGNLGRGHDLETVLAAAESFRGRDDVVFLFIGDGARKDMVSAAARENPCIRMLPYQPRATLSQSLSAGDLHLVTQDTNTEGLMEPSKLYGAMAAGRPVLYVGPGGTEAARTILRERIGEVVANHDTRGTFDAITSLLAGGATTGDRACSALKRAYSRERRTSKIASILRAAAQGASG